MVIGLSRTQCTVRIKLDIFHNNELTDPVEKWGKWVKTRVGLIHGPRLKASAWPPKMISECDCKSTILSQSSHQVIVLINDLLFPLSEGAWVLLPILSFSP